MKGNNMTDPTEAARRELAAEINAVPGSREALQAVHGQIWDIIELVRDFTVIGFMAPLVIVKRKSDGQRGSLSFQNRPRYYFGYQPYDDE
jgi:hypothetical protein